MSDKMLMEDWREYLTEAAKWEKWLKANPEEEELEYEKDLPDKTQDTQLQKRARMQHAHDSGCITIDTIIKSIIAAQKVAEVSDKRDDFVRNAKRQGWDWGTDSMLALGVALLNLSPVRAFLAGLVPGAYRTIKNIVLPVDANTEKGLEAFVDLINIAEPFQQVFTDKIKENIDDQYLIYLRKHHPDDCIEKVMNINQFIQKHYKLCLGKYPSARPAQYQVAGGAGHDLGGIDRPFPATNESKFHDNWRNFLLTEEKL
jgi:hypothetical protein